MTRRILPLQTVYLSRFASEQKYRCVDFFCRRDLISGRVQHTLLYDGLTALIAKDPYSLPYLTRIDDLKYLYGAKLLFGNEPLYINVCFSDNPSNGRWLEAITISDVNQHLLFQ